MADKSLKSKTIKVKGGADYAMVKDRVVWLDQNKEGAYSIVTRHWYYPEQRTWVVKATLKVDGQEFTGHAQEVESDDYKQVNFSSALENCETSAIGRACAAYGLGIQESYASMDEIQKAKRRAPMKYATEKQIEWLRNTAHEVNDQLGDDAETDAWIEDILTIPPQKIPVFKVKDAVDKLKEDDRPKIDPMDMDVTVTEEVFEEFANGKIPY